MTSMDGLRDSASKAAARGKKSVKTQTPDLLTDQPVAQAQSSTVTGDDQLSAQAEFDEELVDAAQTDEEPDNIALLDDGAGHSGAEADDRADFVDDAELDDAELDDADHDDADPDVAAVDKVLSASRRQQAADKNSSIRRLLEERSEKRRMQQDLDYLDFDD